MRHGRGGVALVALVFLAPTAPHCQPCWVYLPGARAETYTCVVGTPGRQPVPLQYASGRGKCLAAAYAGARRPTPNASCRFWHELCRVRWCPTLEQPPAPGLPWPPPSSRSRLAAPRTVRPPQDAWLCSSCLGLLDGECRSSALAAGLGWTLPLGASVLATQLLQLGGWVGRHLAWPGLRLTLRAGW